MMGRSEIRASYDYIVVGAGSAGCVVAARLTEGDANVLLVEAGPPDTDPNIWTPSGWPALWGTERDYAFETIPQRHADQRRLSWPRGRTLGGSSALNGMIYVRGHRTDYDAWADSGCVGWDYASVLPYFKKSENYEGGAGAYHGTGGPLNVARLVNPHPVCAAAVQAAMDLGIPRNGDFNGPDSLGVGFVDLTVKEGRRHSTAAAFLSPARDRPNLRILTGAKVARLLFDGTRCTGIEYQADGDGALRTISSDGEVILAAGAIGSPHLLMLSGIGDESDLRPIGIDVIQHLPGVGKNLHDHALCSVIFESAKPLPRARNNYLESQLFWKSDARPSGPDLQPLFMHLPYYAPGLEGPANAWTLCAGIVRPTSRGALRLASRNAAPLLDPNVMATEADLLAMEQAIRLCIDIGEQAALSEWRKAEIHPGPSARSRGSLREYIRRSVSSYHHQVGTCRMGVDQDAVVDPELRVHGLSGLRVADASIMPVIPSGNTNAPTIMIAEKAADLIRSQAR